MIVWVEEFCSWRVANLRFTGWVASFHVSFWEEIPMIENFRTKKLSIVEKKTSVLSNWEQNWYDANNKSIKATQHQESKYNSLCQDHFDNLFQEDLQIYKFKY